MYKICQVKQMTMNYLGNKLRETRESKGLLLRQVAAKIDIDTALMSKLERGERRVQRELLYKISSVLEIKEDDLIVLWLADKIKDAIQDEPLAERALTIIKDDKTKNLKSDS